MRLYCKSQADIEGETAKQLARVPNAAATTTVPTSETIADMSFATQPEVYDDILRD